MLVPDCRHDDFYNQDFLSGDDKQFIRGYDWAAEQVVDSFFDILEEVLDSDHLTSMLDEKLPKKFQTEYEMEFTFSVGNDNPSEKRKVRTYGEYLRYKLLEHVESERDVMITSMLDNMDSTLFTAIRNKVLTDNGIAEKPKRYYDTRKYMVTGKVESHGVEDADE